MEQARLLRQRLAQGEQVFGTFIAELISPAAPLILAQSGYGYCVIDTEHGCFNPADVARLINSGRQAGICTLVRTAGGDRNEITRALDAGAEGILVPMIRTLDDARRAVASTKYPPLGQRGVHLLRPATNFNVPADPMAHLATCNRTLLTLLQIETTEAAAIIDELAALDGVDGLYLGPSDLSVSMGHLRLFEDKAVMAVAERLARACRQHGKIAATHLGDLEPVKQLAQLGFSMFGAGAAVNLLRLGGENLIAEWRARL